MELVYLYQRVARWIVALCPVPGQVIQIFAGLAIWLLAALLMKRPLRGWQPLAVLITAQVFDAGMDYLAHGTGNWVGLASGRVIAVFWPIVIFAAIRARPKLRS